MPELTLRFRPETCDRPSPLGWRVFLSDSRTEHVCLRGIKSGYHRMTTAATTSFSGILGAFNVICLTLEVDQITCEDSKVGHDPCRYVLETDRGADRGAGLSNLVGPVLVGGIMLREGRQT